MGIHLLLVRNNNFPLDVYDNYYHDKEPGYDKDGYDRNGYDRNGYDKDGHEINPTVKERPLANMSPHIALRGSHFKQMPFNSEGFNKFSIPAKNGTPGFVFTMYAIFLMNQDELVLALEYCDKAIKIPKNYVKRLSLHVKGKILCQVGQYQKALECVDTSLDMRYDEDVKKTRDMIIKEQNQFK